MFRVLIAAFLFLPFSLALAQAKTAKDCEAIKNPMEFNLCLASLSPVRGSGPRRVAPPEEGGPAAASSERSAGRGAKGRGRVAVTSAGTRPGYFYQDGQRMFRYPGGMVVSAVPGGRKRMSFSVR